MTMQINNDFINLIKKIVEGPAKSFCIYWRNYGGFKALLCSIYFWISFLLALSATIINYILFQEYWKWWDDVISIIPSVLGFSLGGYVFLVGFGDKKLMKIMREKKTEKSKSIYMRLNATFVHFIFIQFISLFITVVFKCFHIVNFCIAYFIGSMIFFYAILTIITTAFGALNLAKWFDLMIEPGDKP